MQLGLKGSRVAILAADGVDQVQLVDTRKALEAAGADTLLVAPREGEIQAFDGSDAGDRFPVDRALADAHASEFAALVLPGDIGHGDPLREDARAVQLVREFMAADKPVAAIGRGAVLLVAAGDVRGRALTSSPDLKSTIIEAGGDWVEGPVRVDGKLVTARGSDALAEFDATIVREFGNQIDQARVDELSEESFPASDAPPGPISIGGLGEAARRPADRGEPEARP